MRGRRRPALLAVAAAILLAACLGGWVLASSTGTGRQAGSHVGPPPAGTILVRTAALVGQNAHQVARDLRSHGLSVTIAWAPALGHRPGTVIAVTPSGRLHQGASVQVIAARRPNHGDHGGFGHDHGNGQNGNGNGGD